MFSLSGLVSLVVYLIVAGLIFWLLSWLISYTNPPEPFKKGANIVLMVFAVLVIIGLLLSMISGTPVFIR